MAECGRGLTLVLALALFFTLLLPVNLFAAIVNDLDDSPRQDWVGVIGLTTTGLIAGILFFHFALRYICPLQPDWFIWLR